MYFVPWFPDMAGIYQFFLCSFPLLNLVCIFTFNLFHTAAPTNSDLYFATYSTNRLVFFLISCFFFVIDLCLFFHSPICSAVLFQLLEKNAERPTGCPNCPHLPFESVAEVEAHVRRCRHSLTCEICGQVIPDEEQDVYF